MSLLQINHSEDLHRLREDGYSISVRDGYLVVRDIPYVDSTRGVRRGRLISNLELSGDRTTKPSDHKIYFEGDFPCDANGAPMEMLRLESKKIRLSSQIEIDHTFSRKPANGYTDYHHKITTYASLICREATQIDPDATALTGKVEEPDDTDYPFNYYDTASARAEINVVSMTLAEEAVAIIGLGGTGSYVLDLVAKTPARAIHLFDSDEISTHNAFRSPGAPSVAELQDHPSKVEYFGRLYSNMNRRIVLHDVDLKGPTLEQLAGVTFAFICIDRGADRKQIVETLDAMNVPFVDVGIGLYRHGDSLGGQVRVSTSLPGRRESAKAHMPLTGGDEDNVYDKNIQVADLNALNACLAVIRWKKLRGFYIDSEEELLSTYTIAFNTLNSDT